MGKPSSTTLQGPVTHAQIGLSMSQQSNAADRADAYSVGEFCARHSISPQLFYKLKPKGLMPATFKVGSRVLISREAAAEWRREREIATRACHDR
jgi:hypothetical protein